MSSASIGADLERRTIKHFEACGYKAERVSRTGRHNGGDLFGVADIIAIGPLGIEILQVTTRNNRSARRRKIIAAALPVSVRLIYWFKDKNRWTFLSEVVPAAGVAVT